MIKYKIIFLFIFNMLVLSKMQSNEISLLKKQFKIECVFSFNLNRSVHYTIDKYLISTDPYEYFKLRDAGIGLLSSGLTLFTLSTGGVVSHALFLALMPQTGELGAALYMIASAIGIVLLSASIIVTFFMIGFAIKMLYDFYL